MPDISFESRSPRLDLPLLFAGQIQKEAFVNESLVRLDALVHCAVEAVAVTPPAAPAEGQCWLVGTGATGTWSGKADSIACFQQGQWLYQLPRDGMRVLNRATGQMMQYRNSWRAPATPPLPAGGTTIDIQARTAIAAIIDVLSVGGILATQ